MKTRYAVALSMLAGMAIGAVAVQSLHAQAKPPVYMIALNEVTNADRYAKEYVPPAQASVKAHGGVYVVAGPGTMIEGDLPKRTRRHSSLGQSGGTERLEGSHRTSWQRTRSA